MLEDSVFIQTSVPSIGALWYLRRMEDSSRSLDSILATNPLYDSQESTNIHYVTSKYHDFFLSFFLHFQVMFETYQFSGVYVAIQAVLTLYAQGKWNLIFRTTIQTLSAFYVTGIWFFSKFGIPEKPSIYRFIQLFSNIQIFS